MSSGSSQWANHNLRKGYDGRSKWTQKDYESYYGKTSPAKSRREKTPKRYDDEVPF